MQLLMDAGKKKVFFQFERLYGLLSGGVVKIEMKVDNV